MNQNRIKMRHFVFFLLLILSPTVWARNKSPLFSVYQDGQVRVSTSLPYNSYEVLGIELEKGVQLTSKDVLRRANQLDIKYLDPKVKSYSASERFKGLAQANLELIHAQANSAFTLMGVVLDESARKDYFIKYETHRKQILLDLASKAKLDALALDEKHPLRMRAHILATVIACDAFKNEERFAQQKVILDETRKLFRNPKLKANYDLAAGKAFRVAGYMSPLDRIRATQGHIKIVVPYEGKNQTHYFKADDPKQFKFSEVIKQINIKNQAKATVNLSLQSLVMLGLMYEASNLKAQIAFKHDPAAFVNDLKSHTLPMVALSFAGYTLGSSVYSKSGFAEANKALNNMLNLAESGTLYTNLQKRGLVAQAMASTNLGRTSFGMMGAMSAGFFYTRHKACFDFLQDRPMPSQVYASLAEQCDKSYIQFLTESFPSIAMNISGMMSAEMLIFLGGKGIQTLKGTPLGSTIRQFTNSQFERVLKKINPTASLGADGALMYETGGALDAAATAARMNNVVRGISFVRSLGAITIQFAAFTVAIEVTGRALAWTYQNMSAGFALSKNQGSFLNDMWRFAGADFGYQASCQTAHPKEAQDSDLCLKSALTTSEKVWTAFDAWSNHVKAPLQNRLNLWTNYYAEAANMQAAAKLFYQDMVNQIYAKRASKTPFVLKNAKATELSTDSYYEYSLEALPLFRSHPFFGAGFETLDRPWLTTDDKGKSSSRDWAKGFVENEKKSLETAQDLKSMYINSAGQWLKSRVKELNLNSRKKDEFAKLGSLLNPNLKTKVEKQKSQIEGLNYLFNKILTLSQGVSGAFEATCRGLDEKQIILKPDCLYFYTQVRISDHIFLASQYLQAAIVKNKVEKASLRSAYEVYSLLGSMRPNDRLQGLELLRTLASRLRYSDCMDAKNQRPDCVFLVLWSNLHSDPSDSLKVQEPMRLQRAELERVLNFLPFNYRQSPDYGGYVRVPGYLSSGALPLAPGAKYFMNYFWTFNAMGVDSRLFPSSAYNSEIKSLAQYLLMSSICGPTEYRRDTAIVETSFTNAPKFLPPALPLDTKDSYCSSMGYQTKGTMIYHYIPGVLRGERSYAGIVDLLFSKLSNNLKGKNFETWWTEKGLKPLKEQVIRDQKEMLRERGGLGIKTTPNIKELTKYVMTGEGTGALALDQNLSKVVALGHSKNLISAVQEELNFYFKNVLTPVYQNRLTGWVEDTLITSNGVKITSDLRGDQNFKKNYLESIRQRLTQNVGAYIRYAAQDKVKGKELFSKIYEDVERLRQLFNAFDETYFEEMNSGQRPIYPALSYLKFSIEGQDAKDKSCEESEIGCDGQKRVASFMSHLFIRIDALLGTMSKDGEGKLQSYANTLHMIDETFKAVYGE